MTAAELKARIEADVGNDWMHTNAHGCDLKRCLIEPLKLSFDDPLDSSVSVRLW